MTQCTARIVKNGNQESLELVMNGKERVFISPEDLDKIVNPVVQNGDEKGRHRVRLVDENGQLHSSYNGNEPEKATGCIDVRYDFYVAARKAVSQMAREGSQQTGGRAAPSRSSSSPTLQGVVGGVVGAANGVTRGGDTLIKGIESLGNVENLSGLRSGVGGVASGTDRILTTLDNQGGGSPSNAEKDERNFLLSTANWLDEKVFNSLAEVMPISALKSLIKMLGGCFSGLFRTLGYLVEGDFSKLWDSALNWLKDVGVVAGLSYAGYYLFKKSGLFSSDKDKTTSSTTTVTPEKYTTTTSVTTDQTITQTHTAGGEPIGNVITVLTGDGKGKVVVTDDRFVGGGRLTDGTTMLEVNTRTNTTTTRS